MIGPPGTPHIHLLEGGTLAIVLGFWEWDPIIVRATLPGCFAGERTWLFGRAAIITVSQILLITLIISAGRIQRDRSARTVGLGQDGGGGGDAKVTYFLDRDPTCPPRHHSENGLHEGSPPVSRLAPDRLGERCLNEQAGRPWCNVCRFYKFSSSLI